MLVVDLDTMQLVTHWATDDAPLNVKVCGGKVFISVGPADKTEDGSARVGAVANAERVSDDETAVLDDPELIRAREAIRGLRSSSTRPSSAARRRTRCS